jgi:hypothetical protein
MIPQNGDTYTIKHNGRTITGVVSDIKETNAHIHVFTFIVTGSVAASLAS